MIKCCVFDLDGTLLYTLATLTHYVNLVLLRNNLGSITEEECKSFIGNGARLLIKRALLKNGIEDGELCERILNEYNSEYNKDTLYLTEPYEGITNMLSELRARKIKLAVLSNKPNATTQLVVSGIFGDAFDVIYGAREGIALKPAPDSLISLISELGAQPSEVMYVGDTDVDIKAGKAAGVRSAVGVTWGYRPTEELISAGADLTVDSPDGIVREVDLLA